MSGVKFLPNRAPTLDIYKYHGFKKERKKEGKEKKRKREIFNTDNIFF